MFLSCNCAGCRSGQHSPVGSLPISHKKILSSVWRNKEVVMLTETMATGVVGNLLVNNYTMLYNARGIFSGEEEEEEKYSHNGNRISNILFLHQGMH